MKFKIFIWSTSIIAILLSSCDKDLSLGSGQEKSFIKFYGSSYLDEAYDVMSTEDGGFILCGSLYDSEGKSDVYLLKADKFGNKEWSKTFGDSLNDRGTSIELTQDGGYILMGTYEYSTDKDFYVIKTNSIGEAEWSKTYGGILDEEGYDIEVAQDSGYFITGTTMDTAATMTHNIVCMRIGNKGDSIWAFNRGDHSTEDVVVSMKQRPDKSLVFAGSSERLAPSPNFLFNILVFNVNEDGGDLGFITHGGLQDEFATDMELLDDGSIIISAKTESYGVENGGLTDCLILKLTADLEEEWHLLVGGAGTESATGISTTSDGNFIVSGFTNSIGNGGFDQYLIKVDDKGNILWKNTFGDGDNDYGRMVLQDDDGGYSLLGTTGYSENHMISLIKTDPEGLVK